MLQTVSGIKENRCLNKMTVQTLILVTLVSTMGTSMPWVTQNILVIHHHRHHSMHKMVRTVRILVTPVTKMVKTMPQMTQNKLTICHHRYHSMHETARMARTTRTAGTMALDLVIYYVMTRMVTSQKK